MTHDLCCAAQGWQLFVEETGRNPDMVVFASALWDIARWCLDVHTCVRQVGGVVSFVARSGVCLELG